MKIQLKELLVRPVSEMGTSKKVVTCPPDTSVEQAVQLLKTGEVGSVVVVDGLKVVGIFTERDYLEKIGFTNVEEKSQMISAFMTKDPVCLKIHESIGVALLRMREGKFRHLILVDSYGNLQSIVSLREITDYLFSTVTDVMAADEKKTGTHG